MRTLLVVVASALCSLVAAPARSQAAWPERPIQMIVPYPAGGAVDVIARPFAERLGELLGRPVAIVPRDGASGTIGTGAVAAAKPDGYTLGFTANGPLVVQPHVIPTLAYKFDSLVPVCQVFAVQYVLAVPADSPLKTLDDFIAAVKARPGKLAYGFGGVATVPHLTMSHFVNTAQLDLLSVPFRGDPAAIVALRAGEIDSATLNVGLAKAQGFRALATFAEARQPDYPDAPTLKERGYPIVGYAYGGVVAPRGLADDIVRKIDAACEKAVADERFQKASRSSSQEPVYRNSAAFTKVLTDDFVVKRDVVKNAKLPPP
jgi:tripartite-type tricarboxylate transporter receptor subunit TctC